MLHQQYNGFSKQLAQHFASSAESDMPLARVST